MVDPQVALPKYKTGNSGYYCRKAMNVQFN